MMATGLPSVDDPLVHVTAYKAFHVTTEPLLDYYKIKCTPIQNTKNTYCANIHMSRRSGTEVLEIKLYFNYKIFY